MQTSYLLILYEDWCIVEGGGDYLEYTALKLMLCDVEL